MNWRTELWHLNLAAMQANELVTFTLDFDECRR